MLNDALDTYLAVRRAAGFDLVDDERNLRSFVRFASAQSDNYVVADTAIAWARQANAEPQRGNRLKKVIRFARFSHAADARHEVPPQGVFCAQRKRPTPYLYTEEEIERLMAQTASLGPPSSQRVETYRTLIGLLAATGMRIGEAIGLCFHDVTADGLLIRETKFHKSRMLPLHPSTQAALEQYIRRRRQFMATDDHVFVSSRHRPLTHDAIYPTFIKLLTAAGLPRLPGQPRPRLIDFRHTFASNALLACPTSRDHVGNHTLALMTYLGHAHPRSTYWYFESSPALMNDIVQLCEQFIEENKP